MEFILIHNLSFQIKNILVISQPSGALDANDNFPGKPKGKGCYFVKKNKESCSKVSSVNSIDGAVNGTDSCLTGFVKGATLKQNKVNQLVNLLARDF
jgi:hypothetical protein